MLVAIDGPAGAGKSTVARGVARALGFAYLDSGALYRAVALAWLRAPESEPATLARGARIELGERVMLNGADVSEEIRSAAVSAAASRIAADAGVRAALTERQRELLASGDWVAEGRDIGTVVAPAAELKIFLHASELERARRRAAQLATDPELVLAAQRERDARDSERASSPLRAAADAVMLDTTELAPGDVVERIAALARERRRMRTQARS